MLIELIIGSLVFSFIGFIAFIILREWLNTDDELCTVDQVKAHQKDRTTEEDPFLLENLFNNVFRISKDGEWDEFISSNSPFNTLRDSDDD